MSRGTLLQISGDSTIEAVAVEVFHVWCQLSSMRQSQFCKKTRCRGVCSMHLHIRYCVERCYEMGGLSAHRSLLTAVAIAIFVFKNEGQRGFPQKGVKCRTLLRE